MQTKVYPSFKKLSWWPILLIFLFLGTFSCNKGPTGSGQNGHGISPYRPGEDPFLTDLYWSLNETPIQRKLRNIKPFPVGVVYYQQRGDNLDSAKKEFDIIHDLGFTALKQVQLVAPYNPPGFQEEVFHAALDKGISPWYYGKGGWAKITPSLLNKLGINMPLKPENMPAIQKHPKMIEYQTSLMKKRVAKMDQKPPKPKGMGEPGRNNPWMPERLVPHFALWLENEYGDLASLKDAWNCGYIGKCPFQDFMGAARELKGEGFDEYGRGTGKLSKDFRRYRDAMRFQADLIVENYQKTMELYTRWDSIEPERTGGHQIFENQARNTWDLEGQAKTAAIGGSFYSSIHLTHHFFLVDGELTRPVYMQARIVADMFKGGWAATWESTGGPTNHSGYYPTTVDENRITRLMLSYVAAGLKGIGFWMWNSRGEGWEVGEYALCDVQGKPAPRAVKAGMISSKLQEQRFELWEALDEPVVGILYSWENEAMLGRLSLGQYDLNTSVFKTNWDKQMQQYHSEAKIGVSRALMNQQIPYEYVTETDIKAGLAPRYPIIYLPFVIALDHETLDGLMKYVHAGGQLVADFPLLMIDTYGRLNKQRKGSDFEKLFGFQTADYFHTFKTPKSIDGDSLYSYFGDIKLTHGKLIDTYDDVTPAVIQASYGKGKTIVFNFEAGRGVFKPGCPEREKYIARHILDGKNLPFEVKARPGIMAFRRSAPAADHYFLLNDGKQGKARVTSRFVKYHKALDVLQDKEIHITDNQVVVSVPAYSGAWLRLEKELR